MRCQTGLYTLSRALLSAEMLLRRTKLNLLLTRLNAKVYLIIFAKKFHIDTIKEDEWK